MPSEGALGDKWFWKSTGDNEIPRHGYMVGQISQTPLKSARTEALLAIAEATSLYGNTPQEFPINGLAAA